MKKVITPTFQQMRLFEAVARNGSVSRAAEEVHLAQPSVSMQVKALEGKIGLPLTEKVGRELHLTAAGAEVAAASRDVLSRISDMQATLEDMHREVAGPLSVAAVSTAKYFLPQALGQFKRRFPRVEPRLQFTNRETVLARIADNADDLYVTGRPPEREAVVAESFMENLIVLAAPADHPLTAQRNTPLARVAEEPIIGRERGSGTRLAVEEVFEAAGVEISPLMEFDDSEAIKQVVASGFGVAYLSFSSLRLELAAGRIAVLDVKGFPLHRQWFAAHRKGKRLSNAARAFLEFLREEGDRFASGPK
ncbi:LysR family transcriptional regulator [Tropicimonas sediminicola]|uniref:HTH-type transcriptional regulator CbbR n=1 Tax=Tropicimonas sediminicola TaxID=1031541 RepID=A0A239MFM9_9RHOB|nr:LysR family transcriptional regulator [Tropicimonas sediminicola]SNT41486.1 DNA-binding transcriptional regulator, LysR family [Tropicimonas sediminicola]